MNDPKDVAEYVEVIGVTMANALNGAAKVKPVGTVAQDFVNAVKEDLNATNVDAFLYGVSMAGLILTEACAAAIVGSADLAKDHKDGIMTAVEAVLGAFNDVSQVLIDEALEEPMIEAEFNGIVSGM